LSIGGRSDRKHGKDDQASNSLEDIDEREWTSLHLRQAGGGSVRNAVVGQDNGSQVKADSANPVVQLVMPPGAPLWKRACDVSGAAVLLIALSPLFAVVALYIKIVSPGPVFFRQERIGYLGHPFTIWKFRTMKANAEEDVHMSHLKNLIKGDQVLTKLDGETDCRWIPMAGILRKSCLDELPQLFNVLKGEMSLVGPRPVPDYEVEEYSLWQRQRFYSLPGMTGLWQVSGKNRLTFSQMMRLDARYSKKYNFFMDQVIFIKTVPAIIGQVMDSIRGRFSYPLGKNISVWRRSLNDFVRQVFL
ncbi:MAG: sugar transferase, partial [Pseudomonadota bacterium]